MPKWKNARCVICNQVSHTEISDDTSPWSSGHFRDQGGGYTCQECDEWHGEIMSDYYLDDEVDGEDEDEYLDL